MYSTYIKKIRQMCMFAISKTYILTKRYFTKKKKQLTFGYKWRQPEKKIEALVASV